MKRLLKASVVFSIAVCVLLNVFPTTTLHAKVKKVNIATSGDDLVLNHFHISKVVDERLDTSNIGYITTGANNFFLTANFEDGLTAEFNEFLNKHVRQNPGTDALELHVITYMLFEKSSFKGAEIAVNTHFALYTSKGEKLFDYVITDTRNIGMNMGAFAAELMQRNLTNFLSESDRNLTGLLAMYKANAPIKVNYFVDKDPEQKNLVPYNPQHPLNVFNFVGKAPSNPRGASGSVSGLRIQYQIRNLGGKAEGYLEILTYFDQAKSWILSKENANQVLKYEQIRFKISAYFTNELIKELNTKTFTLATFHDDVLALRKKYDEQILAYQTQYDQETGNGTNVEAMDNWNRKVAYYDPSYSMNK
jgi:hypothetical protein